MSKVYFSAISRPVVIRLAKPDDALAISSLAEETFFETYAAYGNDELLKKYLALHLSEPKIRADLHDKTKRFLVVEDTNALVGYAKMDDEPAPVQLANRAAIHLDKIYFLKSHQAKGLGVALLQKCLSEAKVLGHEILWLTVYPGNERAAKFYLVNGFTQGADVTFDLAGHFERNLVFFKEIS